MGWQIGAILWLATLALACSPPRDPLNVKSDDPGLKIPAIKKAVQNKDMSVLPQLVADLDSDDPAVRFYAIEALEKLTGERLGFEYHADEIERKPALARWQEWLKAHPQGK